MRGDDDDILDALERAAPFFDAGYTPGSGALRPSALIEIRYCQLMSTSDIACHDEARRLARGWLAEGRRRWKAGFSANPLPHDPQPR